MVILASASPRRRELLRELVESFDVMVSDVDESFDVDLSIEDNLIDIVRKKSKAIESIEDDLVISADTIVVYNHEVLIKPVDAMDAFSTLTKLSGSTHRVMTAVCLRKGSDIRFMIEETHVTFNSLSDEMIWNYINDYKPFDKAGSYGLQELNSDWIASVAGDPTNVVGLPLERLRHELKTFG